MHVFTLITAQLQCKDLKWQEGRGGGNHIHDVMFMFLSYHV